MPKPIGLQRESVSNLGNNLFAFVLASAAVIGVLAYNDAITRGIFSGETLSIIARAVPLFGIIVLVFYYLIDWYDLNLAVYIDEFVGRKQVCLYVIAALLLAALPPLVLGGKTNVAAFLAAIYFPLADLQRNKLLREGKEHLTTKDEAMAYGAQERTVIILRWVLWSFALITFATAVCTLVKDSTLTMLCVGIALVLLWVVACILKVLRSICFLQSEYERRLRGIETPANAELAEDNQHFDITEGVDEHDGAAE